jgi:hypothetical protein
MGHGPPWTSVLCASGIILAICAQSSLVAQETGAPENVAPALYSVPFVGCASSGQVEGLRAPKGTSKSVPVSPRDVEALAYYKSADGIGLLAPRGWYCAGASGSSGFTLFLSPKPIHHDPFSGSWGLEGPAIGVDRFISENGSGRFSIAEIIMRVFPAHQAIATRIWVGRGVPLPSGPYPKDTIKHIGKTIVEYRTPAQTEGLGNYNSWLGKGDLPIVGAVILIVDPPNLVGRSPNLVRLTVRLPPNLVPLSEAIIRYVERDLSDAARK